LDEQIPLLSADSPSVSGTPNFVPGGRTPTFERCPGPSTSSGTSASGPSEVPAPTEPQPEPERGDCPTTSDESTEKQKSSFHKALKKVFSFKKKISKPTEENKTDIPVAETDDVDPLSGWEGIRAGNTFNSFENVHL
jgi:hypothetical protein